MPTPEEIQIYKLSERHDIRVKAKALCQTVRVKTGPGTGYVLGQGKTGLPAICAYLVSMELGYADVSESIAQVASCLAPNIFKSTLKTIQAALSPSVDASPRKLRTRALSYEQIIKDYKIGRVGRVAGWMEVVEPELLRSKSFRAKYSFGPDSPEVKVAVFFWVCTRIMKISKRVQAEPLAETYKISFQTLSYLVQILDDDAKETKERLEGAMAQLRTANANAKAAPVASTSRLNSPTKSALRASGTPSHAGGTKRKVIFSETTASEADDDEVYAPESPSKRQKMTSSPNKSLSTRTPRQAHSYEMPIPPPALTPTPTKALITRPAIVAPSSEASFEHSASEAESNDGMVIEPEPPTAPAAGPSTPRRAPQATYRSTPSRHRESPPPVVADLEGDEEDENEALPVSRRFRPVMLDRAQWAQRAPRLERQRAAAERNKQVMVERWGHPFEALRPGVTVGQ